MRKNGPISSQYDKSPSLSCRNLPSIWCCRCRFISIGDDTWNLPDTYFSLCVNEMRTQRNVKISFSSLPSFRDIRAIVSAQYLWIDGVCITSDRWRQQPPNSYFNFNDQHLINLLFQKKFYNNIKTNVNLRITIRNKTLLLKPTSK